MFGGAITNRLLILAALIVTLPFAPAAARDELAGTDKLVSATRKLLDTGEVKNAFGKNPKGSIMYDKDGRFLVMIISDGRPKPESIDKMTDQQRADLLKTLVAYGGTYTFDGKKVEHHIDLSWNEIWSGTTVIRDVSKENNRLVYTTRPAPFAGDGEMSVVTLVWEKVTPPQD
jgi:hypothetical protein